ncbi:hypothetical protein NECAME_01791 [Necator americanus]|uniref:Neurotransmitter-gated ion-channel ligand-binding domain-containing protein n=1 Tax=Necator americanus TaxID=51031 RepID=W2TP66_NECAM|nr:hypothetical protein NECAME_01791 [Necator americanus]ETN83484.1 hypothetical protein NECAME_01791 [Necator americanus]
MSVKNVTDFYSYQSPRRCANDTEIIDHLLFDTALHYNKHKLPSNPVDVRIEMWVQEVTSVSELTQDFEIERLVSNSFYKTYPNVYEKIMLKSVSRTVMFMIMRMYIERVDRLDYEAIFYADLFPDLYMNEYWTDPGLAYDILNPCQGNLSFDWTVLQNIWTPNTCFVNSKKAQIHSSPFRNVFLMVFPNGGRNLDLTVFWKKTIHYEFYKVMREKYSEIFDKNVLRAQKSVYFKTRARL